MNNKEIIEKIINERSVKSSVEIKDYKHSFKIENVFDSNKSDGNGVYDLDYALNNSSVFINYLEAQQKENPNYSLTKYSSFGNFSQFVSEKSQIKVEIFIGSIKILESSIKGTKTSCGIGLFSGLSVNRLSELCSYFKINNIDPFEFFKSYFLQIMKENKITQMIFSNKYYSSSYYYGEYTNFMNYILNEICQVKTECGRNKNGGSNICTWILTDYVEYEEEDDEYNTCSDCGEDYDYCDC